MAQQNDDQPNSENHGWESIGRDFSAKVASRHTGMAERIVSHVTAPIQRVALAAKSFYPRLARKIAGNAGWSGAFVSRVSAFSDRISRAVQLTESEREPIERVWFDREQAFGPEWIEEGDIPSPKAPEAPRAAEAKLTTRETRPERRLPELQPAGTRVTAPSTKRAAPGVQRSAIAKTIQFAAAKQSRLERTPLVGFSRPMIESMGIFPSKPPAEERGVPMPSSREELEMPLKHAPTIERTPAPAPSGEIPAISRAVETGIRHESPSEIAARPSATVPRYLKRIQAPFSPESTRSSLIARKPSFEGVVQKKPVSVGFTPPAEAIETEPQKPSIMEELALKPRTWERIPTAESRAKAPISPHREAAAPSAPMRKRIEPTPPPTIEHVARKPLVEATRPPTPQRPRAIIEEIGTKEPPAPIARAVAPAFKPSEPGIAPTPGEAIATPPPAEPPTQPLAREEMTEHPTEKPAPREIVARAMVPEPPHPVIEEHKPPGTEMAEAPIQATIEPPPPVQRKAEAEPIPTEKRPDEEAEIEEGLAETILRKYEPQEIPPRIMEKPLPSTSRLREEAHPPEEVPEESRTASFAESILSKYEPPKGVRQTEEAPLPVSTQRDFEMYTSSAMGEGILRKTSETGEVPEALPFAEGVPQLPPSLQPKRAISRKPTPGAGEAFIPFGTGVSREESESSYVQMSPAEARPPETRQEGAYKRPELVLAPIGPRARAEGESSRHIARAAEDRAATSATGTAEGQGASGEQAPGEGPDTEAIAREVYAIIRRRLTVERERIGRRNL